MTLHWWMHWFWVTSLLTLHASIGITHAAPQSEELRHVTDVEIEQYTQLERQSRAMYYPKTFQVTSPIPVNVKEQIHTEENVEIITPNLRTTTEVPLTTWPNTNAPEVTTVQNNVSNVNDSVNLTETQNVTFSSKKRNLTRPDYVKDDGNTDGVSESRIVTEKPLSLETTFLQTRIPPNIESSRRVIDHDSGGMDTGAIAGISFAAVVLVALAGSTAFVLYRRRYLNKPQTLNDKCSNPDSSGYLDDSTVRDNSEEMYSLDNDSFLNSLEAMTIQNYWTDTVKHTKL